MSEGLAGRARLAGARLALRGSIASSLAALCVLAWPAAAAAQAARSVTVAVLSLADDPRYDSRRLEKRYPGQPLGRLADAVKMGLDSASFELEAADLKVAVREVQAPGAAELPRLLQQLRADKVAFWVLDLPEPQVAQAVQAAGGAALLINASSAADGLRGAQCAAQLLHTYPSQSMLADALAQYLAARNWRQVWMLQGPTAADQAIGSAWQRAAKRYGLKILDTKAFKLSGDPRERDLANTRLLTSDRNHDVVAVADADGEFARTLPYATQQPRPVVGSNGLVALPWHEQWERNGGPQVNRRFQRAAQRPMASQDWAAWVAGKAVAVALAAQPKGSPVDHARLLRGNNAFVDGSKGPRLSFRAWDGQLRQPILLTHVDGVVGVAPVDGVLHPSEVMDTLGVDEKESACKARP